MSRRAMRMTAVLAVLALPVSAADPQPTAAGSPALTARDGMVMEIVPLRHRLVDDLVPTLRALLAPGGTVTGLQDQLVIRTTPENLAELKRVLGALDTKLRTLRITVRQDVEAHSRLREDEFSARVRAGDAAARVGGPGRGPGASVGCCPTTPSPFTSSTSFEPFVMIQCRLTSWTVSVLSLAIRTV